MYGLDTNALTGRILIGAQITDDRCDLHVTLDGGTLAIFGTEADCCSDTWIEHITIPELGGLITGITESADLPTWDGTEEGQQEEYDYLAVYHTVIRTTKGELIVEYRNSSNGYYGGQLTGPKLVTPPPPKFHTLHDGFHA